ncbi:hypothetical protein B0H17DRAFT_547889 [Mycena rosella]|uniref:Uncharacterized protein n=1 Tax=Mycena rosella TaxID=1033263 RepID=A0AAD7DI60_MYCRO|nr:hypothetical protein B0H17DRAFT_547889 [Mycena rosella]
MKFYSALFALMAVSSVVAAPAGGKDGLSILRGNKAGKGGKAAASQNPPAVASAADNSTAVASSADNSTATSVDNSANSTAATGTATAAASIRTRPCDMGDQSLAGGLQASTLVGFGQQAAVTTLQNATAAADFTDGVTRLQQFSSSKSRTRRPEV